MENDGGYIVLCGGGVKVFEFAKSGGVTLLFCMVDYSRWT